MDWVRTQPEGGIAVMFVLTQVLCIFAALTWPDNFRYLHLANIDVTMKAIAPLGVMALGVGVLMIAREYDLSVGALYSFLSIVCAHWSNWLGGDIAQAAVWWAPFVGLFVALCIGAAIGSTHAFVTLRFAIPSFITTRGGMLVWKSATLFYHGAVALRFKPSEPFATIFGSEPLAQLMTAIGGENFGDSFRFIPSSILWLTVMSGLFYQLLQHHKLGNHFYAVGGNRNDTPIWITALVVTGGLAAFFWGSWLCLPFFIVYGVLYGSAGDSRWHECGHGTAFKTPWKNDVVYQIACFMTVRNPAVWRWSHPHHHTDTIIVGREPEIITMRPPEIATVLLNVFGVIMVPKAWAAMIRYSAGRLTGEEKDFIPESEQPKVSRLARVWCAIYAAAIACALLTHSFLPLMLIGLPSMYGAWHMLLTGLTQHIGLAEDVLDRRLNCRTMYINRFSRFVYWNMNYHIEHHMFPMVPYHRLPELQKEILADCPPPYQGFWACYREIIPTLWRQSRDPNHFAERKLPPTARRTPPLPSGDIG